MKGRDGSPQEPPPLTAARGRVTFADLKSLVLCMFDNEEERPSRSSSPSSSSSSSSTTSRGSGGLSDRALRVVFESLDSARRGSLDWATVLDFLTPQSTGDLRAFSTPNVVTAVAMSADCAVVGFGGECVHACVRDSVICSSFIPRCAWSYDLSLHDHSMTIIIHDDTIPL